MSDLLKPNCPECDEGVDRREFMLKGTAGLIAAGSLAGAAPRVLADDAPAAAQTPRQPRPAEALIRELFGTLTDEQKRQVVFPWNDRRRQGMFNRSLATNIGQAYTRPQRELNERILRAISNGDDGYRLITRGGTFDNSRSFENCGAHIFGDPSGEGQFAWVFSGHHITVRCDGNSQPNAAFGGPMYYGHSPDGLSQRNIFNYQTRSVQSVFDALNENQRNRAIVVGSPGEQERSVQFTEQHPGIPASDLTADQRALVATVMRNVLSPYRREDADEVMEIVRRNGGIERIHLAFYRDRGSNDTNRWHFWRLDGPGFVWNFRVLPHVHTFVNIAAV